MSEEVHLLKESFLNLFSIRLRDDERLLMIFLSEGSLECCQRALARRFCVISSRICVGIEREFACKFWGVVESQAAAWMDSVKFWTATSILFCDFSLVQRFILCSNIS